MKTLLILRASKDVCDVEINQIKTIAEMHGMQTIVHIIDTAASITQLAAYGTRFDYVYLATHANPIGFGDDGYFVEWYEFAQTICPIDVIADNAVFLLACCRGGVRQVSYDIFAGCEKTQFVCGARWKLTAPDLTAGFHAFIYNMEYRRLQPDQSAKRASKATGYDFLCYDRVEIERTKEFEDHKKQIWGA